MPSVLVRRAFEGAPGLAPNLAPNVSESVTLSSAVTLVVLDGNTYAALVYDTVQLQESYGLAFFPLVLGPTETVTIAESTVVDTGQPNPRLVITSSLISLLEGIQLWTFACAASDTSTVSDSAAISIVFGLSTSSSVTLSETVSLQVTPLAARAVDTISVSEGILGGVQGTIVKSDTTTLSESVTVQSVSPIAESESITLSENVSGIILITISMTETVTLSETRTIQFPKPIAVVDSITLSESSLARYLLPAQTSEALTLTDTPRVQYVSPLHVSESSTVSESFKAQLWNVAQSQTMFAGVGTNDSIIGGNDWATPNNILAVDGSNAVFPSPAWTGISHYLKSSGFGFTLPSDAAITGIQLDVYCQSSPGASGISEYSILLAKGGIVTGNDAATPLRLLPGASAWVSYGGPTSLWGLSLSYSDINDTNFGAGFSVYNPSSYTANVDAMRITVYYLASAIILHPTSETLTVSESVQRAFTPGSTSPPVVSFTYEVSESESATATESVKLTGLTIALRASESPQVTELVRAGGIGISPNVSDAVQVTTVPVIHPSNIIYVTETTHLQII